MAKRKGNKKISVPALIITLVLVVVSSIFEATGVWDYLNSLIDDNSATTSITAEETVATVHFIDVGQGDCSLFISDDETMLIDCGEVEYADTVLKALEDYGVEKLDYAVVTHAHTDHMGGMAKILDNIATESIIISEPSEDSASTSTYTAFLDAADKCGADIIQAEPNYTFSLGLASCRILSPFNVSSSEENNNSVVMYITAGTTSFLMTGDAEKSVETALVEEYPLLRTTFLKVGHHGSNTSSSDTFLNSVQPEIAVISVGEDNSYGHPTEKVMDRLAKHVENIYRTDIDGTVTVICSKDMYEVQTERY